LAARLPGPGGGPVAGGPGGNEQGAAGPGGNGPVAGGPVPGGPAVISQWVQLPGGRWISEKDPGYPFLAAPFQAAGIIRLAPLFYGALGCLGLFFAWIAARRVRLRRADEERAAPARRDLAVGLALAASWFSVWGLYAAYTWTGSPFGTTLQFARFYVPPPAPRRCPGWAPGPSPSSANLRSGAFTPDRPAWRSRRRTADSQPPGREPMRQRAVLDALPPLERQTELPFGPTIGDHAVHYQDMPNGGSAR
jgi:hypothetical protein